MLLFELSCSCAFPIPLSSERELQSWLLLHRSLALSLAHIAFCSRSNRPDPTPISESNT